MSYDDLEIYSSNESRWEHFKQVLSKFWNIKGRKAVTSITDNAIDSASDKLRNPGVVNRRTEAETKKIEAETEKIKTENQRRWLENIQLAHELCKEIDVDMTLSVSEDGKLHFNIKNAEQVESTAESNILKPPDQASGEN